MNNFTFNSNRVSFQIIKGKRIKVEQNLSFPVRIKFIDNEANLGYGFNSKMYNVVAKESGLPNENYRLHSSVVPRKGDELIHNKSGRVFEVGQVEGYIHYIVPLLENGKEVAKLRFEDYYKD